MATAIGDGLALLEAGQLDKAAEHFGRLVAASPGDARSWHYLGIVAARQKDFPRSLELMEKALELDPNSADFHHNLASTYRVMGRFADAEQHYATALRLKPDYAEAYFNLSAVRKFTSDDPEMAEVERLLAAAEVSDEDRCFLHFAAGKMLDDMGKYDEAFAHYEQGNRLRGAEFDPRDYQRQVDRLVEIFDRQRVRIRQDDPPEPLPVFIVGMPRSGTTLVEQILASHDQVYGGGELADITNIAGTMPQHATGGARYPDCVPQLGVDVFRGFGQAYLKRLRTLDGRATRIVNKTPGNVVYLGLIAMLLPGARVIHCRRDPLDACLSCYFQRFRTGQEFSYSLEHLGFYYRMYRRLMAHWHETLPWPVFDVDYETLVADPEPTARGLLDFCQLEWDDRCLRFHETKRPVTTASNWQVRRPIYQSAVRRWQRYAAHLEPLRAELGGCETTGGAPLR